MRPPAKAGVTNGFIWDLLTFNRLLTGPVIHLIYWAGLGVIVLIGFSIAGAGVGLAIREGDIMGVLLAFPVFIMAILAMGVLTLLWRAFCEFYVAIFRISDDLRALRQSNDATGKRPDSTLI
jgi:hypothetical protein